MTRSDRDFYPGESMVGSATRPERCQRGEPPLRVSSATGIVAAGMKAGSIQLAKYAEVVDQRPIGLDAGFRVEGPY
jgi:hypothetical protein